MKLIARILAWLVALVVVAAIGAVGWLYINPPEEFRVANSYSAKIICSSVFVSGRNADEVLVDDVQAPGHWLLKYVSFDRGNDVVTAKLFGFLAAESAVYRPGLGCASAPNGDLDAVAPSPSRRRRSFRRSRISNGRSATRSAAAPIPAPRPCWPIPS